MKTGSLVVVLAGALVFAGMGSTKPRARADEFPPTPCGTYTGHGCAPTSRRIDLRIPSFSNPTKITNPLFPISRLRSAVFLGHEGAAPFRSETTLLPRTATVAWNGRRTRVRLSQYLAYRNGRIEEIAVDRYAQADDGSVWYFGEDVMDYRQGTVDVSEGTWLAGREGPPAMIMPAHPKPGDVFRLENIPGIVFEEVTVKAVNTRLHGVRGALLADELHSDGSIDRKVYAPDRGEFWTEGSGDLEAQAVAAPADAAPGPPPTALHTLVVQTSGLLESTRLSDWEAVSSTLQRVTTAWTSLRHGQPARVAAQLSKSLRALGRAVGAHQSAATTQKAIDVLQSALDLALRYRPPAEVNASRFELWTQQLRVDARAGDLAGVSGDVAVLEWIRDRFAYTLGAADGAELQRRLHDVRAAADARNLPAAADHAARLYAWLRGVR
jgi:hypothetical protein